MVNTELLKQWFMLPNISNMKFFLVKTTNKRFLENLLLLEKRVICRNLIVQRIQELEEETPIKVLV